jgi:hypothetical protein
MGPELMMLEEIHPRPSESVSLLFSLLMTLTTRWLVPSICPRNVTCKSRACFAAGGWGEAPCSSDGAAVDPTLSESFGSTVAKKKEKKKKKPCLLESKHYPSNFCDLAMPTWMQRWAGNCPHGECQVPPKRLGKCPSTLPNRKSQCH